MVNPFDSAFIEAANLFTKSELYEMYVNTCRYHSVPWKAAHSRFARQKKKYFVSSCMVLYWYPKEV